MSAKARKGGGKPQKDGEVSRQQAPLEAVLLADSFDITQRPISFDQPRALFPLANVPLIEYSLEFLASNDVALVYVVCCAHAEKIRAYIDRGGKWSGSSGMRVQVIVTPKVLHLLSLSYLLDD